MAPKRNRSENQVDAVDASDPNEYEVESIVAVREVQGEKQFLVKWKNYEHIWNQWIPPANLSCDELIEEFLKSSDQRSKKQASAGQTKIKQRQIQSANKKIKPIKESESLKRLTKGHSAELAAFDAEFRQLIDKYSKFWRLRSVESKGRNKIIVLTRNNTQEDEIIKRKKALLEESLSIWESIINGECIRLGFKPLKFENKVDLVLPPSDFTYISQNVLAPGIRTDTEAIIGCNCEPFCSSKTECCPLGMHAEFAYRNKDKLRHDFVGKPIFECNSNCKCDKQCANRTVQRGRQIELCIFRTDDGRGWGVKTLEPIKRGSFVLEYVGEIVSSQEADDRYEGNNAEYLFDLDFHDWDAEFVIDATTLGNESHFVNHSCEPNLTVHAVYIDHLDVRLPRIALFATQDIAAGQELTFDYAMTDVQPETADNGDSTKKPNDLAAAQPRKKATADWLQCKCGSSKCRGSVFLRK